MNLSSSKYDPKVRHTKIANHSNLSPSIDSKIRIDKNIVWTVLNQVVAQLGPSLSNQANFG